MIPKKLIVLLLGLLLTSCAVTREDVPADLLPQYDALVQQVQKAEESPDPSDDAPAEDALAALESRVAQRNAEPLAGLLPYGLGGLALEAVGALASRRKRRLYGSALKNLSTGQLASAGGDMLKAWGARHSSPQPPEVSA